MKKDEIEKIFDNLIAYNSKYDCDISSLFSSRKNFSGKFFFYLVALPAMSLLFLIPLALYFPEVPMVSVSPLLAVALGYVGIIFYQISLIVEQRKDLVKLAKNTPSIILTGVKKDCIEDISIIESLLKNDRLSIEYVHKHLVVERLAFERRVGVLVGALEKIGILPGLLTLVFAFWSKYNTSSAPYIVEGTAIAVLLLYIMAFNFHFHFNRLDRYIGLFEVAIDRARENESTSDYSEFIKKA